MSIAFAVQREDRAFTMYAPVTVSATRYVDVGGRGLLISRSLQTTRASVALLCLALL